MKYDIYSLIMAGGSGNTIVDNVVVVDTENSYACSEKGLVVLMGVKDLLVIQEGNATLVMRKNKSEEIKQVVSLLKSKGLHEYI